jgi:hypothetical protein
VAFAWAFYTGAMAARSYWQVSDVVDSALERGGRSGPGAVRDLIVRGAADAEVPVDPANVEVTHESRIFQVKVRWYWPVITWRGDQLVNVPLSMERSAARP